MPTNILLKFDKKVREIFVPYRESLPVRAISWLSDVGDQPQMRIAAGALIALGLVAADARMLRAGTRMLVAHELATAVKSFVKHRVDRSRPRSASSEEEQKPKAGRDTSKEETSFPSGHSSGVMALACAFAREYPEYRGPALAAATSVALAQIPRCAHYPSDVAAGMALGAAAEKVVDLAWSVTRAVLSR